MANTNYISCIVQILEEPRKIVSEQNGTVIKARAQLAEIRTNDVPTLITLTFWGKLSEAVLDYYQPTDYIVIEGYLSVKDKQNLESKFSPLKYIEITVLKIYPFLLGFS